ncbi:MAG: hypothetical protein J6D54_03515 [Olsenella sp.]|nr:hypothetical protein [Olsenella sp.]
MIIQIENYQIRPYPNMLCWELWKYREVKSRGKEGNEQSRMDWVSEKVYPSTLGIALAHVQELLMKEDNEVVGLAEAIEKAEAIRDRILDIELTEGKE